MREFVPIRTKLRISPCYLTIAVLRQQKRCGGGLLSSAGRPARSNRSNLPHRVAGEAAAASKQAASPTSHARVIPYREIRYPGRILL